MEGVRPISPPGKKYCSSEEMFHQNFMKTNFYPARTAFSSLKKKKAAAKLLEFLIQAAGGADWLEIWFVV